MATRFLLFCVAYMTLTREILLGWAENALVCVGCGAGKNKASKISSFLFVFVSPTLRFIVHSLVTSPRGKFSGILQVTTFISVYIYIYIQ